MTKRAEHSVRQSLAKRAQLRAFPGLVALGLVVLQLATALHFALVPHGFNADGRGFVHVHVHRSLARATEPAHGRPTLVTGIAACAPESCPFGFAGPVSALLASSALASLIAPSLVASVSAPSLAALPRKQALLNAPKTSPPRVA